MIKNFLLLIFVFSIPTIVLANDEFKIRTENKTIYISSGDWIKMQDSASHAKNYEQKNKQKYHKYGRVITVFLLPMSEDRQMGMKISNNEYLEFFITTPGFITAQTRIDKGDYWVLCRETFLPKETSKLNANKYKSFLSTEENKLLWSLYQSEIDETRYIIKTEF